jgi:recombinational DNA repair protein RecT
MRLKTVIRRASKLWPQSAELARAVEIDERADEGVTQELPGDLQEIMDAEDIEEGTHGFGRLEMPEESKEDKPNA